MTLRELLKDKRDQYRRLAVNFSNTNLPISAQIYGGMAGVINEIFFDLDGDPILDQPLKKEEV
jgi:hypothetical protein